MEITVHHERVFALLDVLLPRWKEKRYPYNRPDAIIPQTIIPAELRKKKKELAWFYFYICIYMRGGIESLQAFRALLRMRTAHPHLFDPLHAQWWPVEEVQLILKTFIGWDSKAASINWVENSRRLVGTWGDDPLALIRGVTTYEEALRRIKNKRTKAELAEANKINNNGHGFRGFQPKMVSMLLYFYDWEGWLEPRFAYPSPADFHNFRLGLNFEAIEVKLEKGERLSAKEALSYPWREAVMSYIEKHQADPLEVSDALWLFSLLLCGNSPLTVTRSELGPDLFSHAGVKLHSNGHDTRWLSQRNLTALAQTCFVCPLVEKCAYAVPAQPYYRKGLLQLNPRPRVERGMNLSHFREPAPDNVVLDDEMVDLLEHIEAAAPA